MPQNKRDMNSVTSHLKKCIQYLKALDRQLSESQYLAGDHITLADIPTGAVLYRLTEQGIDVILPSFVASWYENLKQRSGYKRWVMSDFTELKAREES